MHKEGSAVGEVGFETDFWVRFAPFAAKMCAAGLPDIFIATFASYYKLLLQGHTGLIRESEIKPVESLPDRAHFPDRLAEIGSNALPHTAVIKVNGGLGTSMGLRKAKSLLPIRDGLTFLDITVKQALSAGVPLLLMNSFATDADTLAELARYPELKGRLPLRFLQHKEPKVRQDDLQPVEWPPNPKLEWCPPGHGDLYTALVTSGTLDALLAAGYQYAFISNSDNLGAVLDNTILGYFAESGFPFMMEVTERTEMDKKGGHLARRQDGSLLLRETAQCAAEDTAAFQDIFRHRYFNTNNLWLDLPALKRVMAERGNQLGLPLIRNPKTVDPRDPASTPVYQLETAMGSAIAVFPGAHAIRVPRDRFAPVKTTNQLLLVRSDAFVLTDDYCVVANPKRPFPAVAIDLDATYYKFVNDFEPRFPHGAPSLLQCERLTIQGDFKFGRHVVCEGDVRLINQTGKQVTIPDGAVLRGEYRY